MSPPEFKGHVTHLVSGDLWGGAEAFVHALAREQFRERPNSVSCVVMNPGQLASRLSADGIPTTVLDETRAGFGSLLRSVTAHIDRFAPTILHAHRQKENLLALLSSMGRGKNAPRRITTLHGMPEPIRGAHWLRTSLKHAVNFVTLRHGFGAIVGVSHDIERQLKAKYPPGRVVCVHNGVVMPQSVPRSQRPPGSPLKLLALGRLVPIKRFDRLRELSQALSRASLAPPMITLAGDGPLNAELKQFFLDGNVEISMPGFIADSARLLQETDALVITSDHEGIPMSVLEGLALGVPVFGFSVGGLPEIAASGVPLHLSPAGDVPGLARSIEQFFSQHAAGVRLPPPGDWSFTIDHCAAAYGAIYERAIRS